MTTIRPTPSPFRRLSAFAEDAGGQAALMFALALPALALLGAGALDLSHVTSARSKLQDIADTAALAGANELGLAIDDASAVARAKSFVSAHLEEWPGAPTVKPRIQVVRNREDRVIDVLLEANTPSFFANLLPPGGWNYSARAKAVSVGKTPLCVLVTGSVAKNDALKLKDAARLQAPACLIHSNRDIRVEGGSIGAAMIQAVKTATGVMTPTAGTGASPLDDPFAALPITIIDTCKNGPGAPPHDPADGPKNIVETGTVNLEPGVHCGGYRFGGDAELVLDPGEHWFLEGHLEMKDHARLTGRDTVLFFDSGSHFDFKDQSLVNLDGRKTGIYAGMVMVGMRTNRQEFKISSDNVDSLLGVIYVPNARLVVEGRAAVARDSAWTVIVAKAVELRGTPSLFVNADYTSSDVPVPTGVGPRSGGSQLVR